MEAYSIVFFIILFYILMCGIYCKIAIKKTLPHTTKKDFHALQHRGPDRSSYKVIDPKVEIGFHRLAIRDCSPSGDQPFSLETETSILTWISNGEIYAYDILKKQFKKDLQGSSDCEIIGYLYQKYGIEKTCQLLDGEFAFILIKKEKISGKITLYAARDPLGVRPLFVGKSGKNSLIFASEMKGITPKYEEISPFKPGTIMTIHLDKERIYTSTTPFYTFHMIQIPISIDEACHRIEDTFYKAVEKRLVTDRPLACLLSGGLDSSLVCGVTKRILKTPITTFTIGMKGGTDFAPAKEVAAYIGSDHHEIYIDPEEALQVIEKVIYSIESWDTTTIRASTFQRLIGKYILEHTDHKVILTGEGSDELTGGYLYFHQAPHEQAFHDECIRLLEDIYLYDGLRVDRAMSAHGLEVRIPFLDWSFVDTYLSLPISLRMPQKGYEKWLLRKAFSKKGYIPEQVLRRKKEAFSDGVSSTKDSRFSMIQTMVGQKISDEEFSHVKERFPFHTPKTKEQYYYRMIFEKHFGSQHVSVIPYYRMPKRVKETSDPSARVLDVY